MAEREEDLEWDAEDPGAFTIDLSKITDDLTGATGRWRAAPIDGGDTVVEKSGPTAVVTTGPNLMTVTLEAADTAGLAGWYKHQAFITRSGAEEEKVSEGLLQIFEKLAAKP